MIRLGAGLLSLLMTSAVIVTTSRAAFFQTTDNTGNSVTAGNVDLTDDDAASTRFVLTLEPGESVTRCIEVTYSGTIVDPTFVKLYSGAAFTDTGTLGDWINVTVDEGDGGDFAACTGFVEVDAGPEFADTLTQFGTLTNYATGFGEWDPTGADPVKTYQITLELDAATPNAQQDESVTAITFTWEVQS